MPPIAPATKISDNWLWRTFFQAVKALKTRPDMPLADVVCARPNPSPVMPRLREMQAGPRDPYVDPRHASSTDAADAG
ncbi:hypothetical protein [Methylobacterium sp. ID0610]|uniref:hypothetical protein n=1 Tax=Methylobacterium carpenticola TaxID=3344827 RepID=UPI0036B9D0EE